MGEKKLESTTGVRRRCFTDEFNDEAVQMPLDIHSTDSIASRQGLSGTNVLYGRLGGRISKAGPVAGTLEARLREVERERDVFKRALGILSRSG